MAASSCVHLLHIYLCTIILAIENQFLFTGSRYTGLLLKFVDFVFEQSFGTTQIGTGNQNTTK